MDLEKAKRFGELANQIEKAKLSIAILDSGIENNAWITEIRATDEGQCERSFEFPLPSFGALTASLVVPVEAQTPEMRAGAETLKRVRGESREIFLMIRGIFQAKVDALHAEMEAL